MRRNLIIAGLAAALLLVAGTSASARSSVATASATACHLTSSEQRHLGASYVTSVRVRGVSCAAGKHVVKSFHKCRFENGGPNGKCNRRIGHFSCSEHRYDAVKGVQYSSHVTCSWGGKRVWSTYTQNT
jgi:hypothetical protein